MRGASYDFHGISRPRRRDGNLSRYVLYGLRTLAFTGALFCVVLYWPDNWADLLIAALEWLRYR